MPTIYSQRNPYDQVVENFVRTFQRNEEERRIRHEQESQQRRRRNIGIGLGVAGAGIGGFAAAGAAGGLSGLQGAAIGGQIGYGVGDAAGAGDYGTAALRGLQGYAQVQAIPQLQRQGVSSAEITGTALTGGNLSGLLHEQRKAEERSQNAFARSMNFPSFAHMQDAAAVAGAPDVQSFVRQLQQQQAQAEVQQRGAIALEQARAKALQANMHLEWTDGGARKVRNINGQIDQVMASDELNLEQKVGTIGGLMQDLSAVGPEWVPNPKQPDTWPETLQQGHQAAIDPFFGLMRKDRNGDWVQEAAILTYKDAHALAQNAPGSEEWDDRKIANYAVQLMANAHEAAMAGRMFGDGQQQQQPRPAPQPSQTQQEADNIYGLPPGLTAGGGPPAAQQPARPTPQQAQAEQQAQVQDAEQIVSVLLKKEPDPKKWAPEQLAMAEDAILVLRTELEKVAATTGLTDQDRELVRKMRTIAKAIEDAK